MEGTEAGERRKPGVEKDVKMGSMKRLRTRTNIGTKNVAKVAKTAMKYSEISTRLRAVEQVPHQMSRELNSVEKSGVIALGENRNVVIYRILEPFMEEEKQRKKAVRYHVVDLLRTV